MRTQFHTNDGIQRWVRPVAQRPRCEACGELATDGKLCADCRDKSRPHRDGDPYDDLGGWED
jgi:hypothetical protein